MIPNGVEPVFTPDGPRAEGDYVLAVGTLEPRKNLAAVAAGRARRSASSCASSARAAGADVEPRRTAGSAGSPTRSSPRCTAARAASSTRRSTRASGSRSLEAMACGTPVVTSAGGATEEVAGGAAVLVDPLDPAAIAAGIEEALARRDELVPLGLERARASRWERAAAATARGLRGGGVTPARRDRRRRPRPPAHGRRDLRREPAARACPRSAGDLRFAAITRHPELVPDGHRADRAPGALAGAADGLVAFRGCFAGSAPALVALPARAAARAAVPGGAHRPRPLVRARPDLHGSRRPRDLPLVVPRSVRRARHVLAVSERTKRDLIELYGTAAGEDHRHPARRRPGVRPGRAGGCATTSSTSARSRRGRIRSPQPMRPPQVGMKLVVVGPEREPRARPRARARAAPTSAATSRRPSSPSSTAAPPRSCSRRGYEGFGLPVARGDGVRARRSSPPDDPALREVAGRRGRLRGADDLAGAIRARARRPRPARRRRARAGAALFAGTRPRG